MSIINKSTPGSEVALTPGDRGRSSDESRRRGGAPAGLSTTPRANLLPPEIGIAVRRRAVRRGLRLVIVAAAVLAGLGVAGAWQLSVASQAALTSAQQQTQQLATEKAKYKEVADAISGIKAGEAAVKVGGSTDIDWSDYLSRLQATLPSGVQLTSVTIKSADAVSSFTQSTVPLEGSRIATITFTASSSTLPSIPDWIDGLSTLPGFADASPNSVNGATDGYTATVTMHVNTDAYSHRFAPEQKDSDK